MKLIAPFCFAAVFVLPCTAEEPAHSIIPLPEPAFEGKSVELGKGGTGSPVSNTYKPPFAFTGTIEEVRIELR